MSAIVRDSLRDPVVVELAFQLYEDCDCLRCLKCIVETIDTWTREHYVYVSDGAEIEIINTPGEDIRQIAIDGQFGGDCDDVAVFVAAMFKALGLNTRFAVIKTQPNQNYSHVFVEVEAAGDWVVIDPTVARGTRYNHYGKAVHYV